MTTQPAAKRVLLSIKDLSKRYGGVRALESVSLDARSGEVHAIIGENGAGKSTLVKILGGAVEPDEGRISIEGNEYSALTPRQAQELGIAIIYQEFNLVPWLSVEANLFLGREQRSNFRRLDRSGMRKRAIELLDFLDMDLDPDEPVASLSVADRQRVEIVKALTASAKVILMDEPSAVLAGRDLEHLFQIIRTLTDQGVGVVYISHRLEEVFALADVVTVLKDGQKVGTRQADQVSRDDLIRMMVGRDLKTVTKPQRPSKGDALLEVDGLQLRANSAPLSFAVHSGEIVGIAGMVGSGRTSLAQVLAGVQSPVGGRIRMHGRELDLRSPGRAIRERIALVPEDRLSHGVLLSDSIQRNISLPSLERVSDRGLINGDAERKLALAAVDDFDIRPNQPNTRVELLSGGNQQKVVLAKWLERRPPPVLVILDEPTRGVDVGAKFEIHRVIEELGGRGTTVLLISSELPEIVALSGVVHVMREGSIAGSVEAAEINEEAIMRLAVSTTNESNDADAFGQGLTLGEQG